MNEDKKDELFHNSKFCERYQRLEERLFAYEEFVDVCWVKKLADTYDIRADALRFALEVMRGELD